MAPSDRAGQPAAPADLVDVPQLVTAYYTEHPDVGAAEQRVLRHVGAPRVSLDAGVQRGPHRRHQPGDLRVPPAQGIDGPLFLGRDTHALSEPAFVDRAGGVRRQRRDACWSTPRPLHADAGASRTRSSRAQPRPHRDGLRRRRRRHPVAQPARATAASSTTRPTAVRPTPTSPGGSRTGPTSCSAAACRASAGSRYARARAADTTGTYDFLGGYVEDLPCRHRHRRDPRRRGAHRRRPARRRQRRLLGRDRRPHGLDLTVVNPLVDPTWRFMTLDWDGKIRMDCSSPYAMASLIGRKDEFQIATGNDADADRHGIVTPDAGLMNPNHYLAVAIDYLFAAPGRAGRPTPRIGKTLVSLVDDRPGRGRPRPPAGRGAGRLQVVRARTARRVDRLRRRGVARARRSCAGTAGCGPPTRTASCSACWPPRCSR